ncbi:unnamed protein product, partial [Arabidopsis halleri]
MEDMKEGSYSGSNSYVILLNILKLYFQNFSSLKSIYCKTVFFVGIKCLHSFKK